MRKVLSKIKVKISNKQKEKLGTLITKIEVEDAINKLQNRKATGLDGIVYKVWNKLALQYEEAQKDEKSGFNMLWALASVYQDIQVYGIEQGTKFAKGWM